MNFFASSLNRILVVGVVAVIIALVGYIWWIQPAVNQYNQAKARYDQDVQSYSDLKKVADQKPLYLALTKQIQSRLAGVELTADARAYIPSYLKQIENLAKQDGLQVTSVTPQAVPSPTPGASAAPGSTPGPQSVNVGPINSAVKAAGSQNAQTQVTNGVATATGATPIPGQPAPQPSGSPPPGGTPPLGAPAATSPRANAIAYLSRSFTQVPVNMEFSGTYSQLQKFLRDLNKFPKLISVGNVTLTPGAHSAVGQTPTLNIVLPIIAWRLSPSSGGAAPPPPPLRGGTNSTGVGRNGG